MNAPPAGGFSMSDAQDNATKAWESWMKMWGQNPTTAANPAMADAMGQWQEMMKSSFEQLAQNEAFLTAMGKQMAASFQMKEKVDAALEQQLSALRMPTASDVKGLRKRIRQLDDRVEDLAESIETWLGGDARGPAEAMNELKAATEAANRAADAAHKAAMAALEAAEVLQKASAAFEAASGTKSTGRKAASKSTQG